MSLSAAHIAVMASAIANDTSLTTWCIGKFGRPHLVRMQENPANPLSSDDAPWVCLLSWPGGDLGEISDGSSCQINITVGITDKSAGDVEAMQTAARVSRERTSSQAGIEEVGDAALAEEFLERVVALAKSAHCGALIETAGCESDGWSQFPLQVASAVLALKSAPNGF